MKKNQLCTRMITLVVFILITFFTGREIAAAPLDQLPARKRIAIVSLAGEFNEELEKQYRMGVSPLAEEYRGNIRGDTEEITFGSSCEFRKVSTVNEIAEIADNFRQLAEEGYGLIIGLGFRFVKPINEVSADYPGTAFALIGNDVYALEERDNVTALIIRYREGSFLAGVVSALNSNGGKIGVVGGMDARRIRGFVDGYLAGARYQNSKYNDDSLTVIRYLESFNDSTAAYDAAMEMYDEGVNVIYHSAWLAGDGVLEAAADSGKWAIGVSYDQGLALALSDDPRKNHISRNVLTSSIQRYERAIYLAGSEFISQGSLPSGFQSVGLKEGCVDIAVNPYNSHLMLKIEPALDHVRTVLTEDTPGFVEVQGETTYSWSVQISQTEKTGDKTVISVLDFEIKEGIKTSEAELLADTLSSALFRTERCRVIDRAQRESLLGEIEFSQSDLIDEKRRLEIGRLIVAKAVVIGSMGMIGKRFVIDLKLIEVETGLTLSTATLAADGTDTLLDRMDELAANLKVD